MNVMDKIIEISKLLDDLEEYQNGLMDRLKQTNFKISDIEHLIEYNKLKTNQCYRATQKLHELRLERRKLKNDIELTNAFVEHKNKLFNTDNRKMLLSIIGKTNKSLKTSIYKNRFYSDEQLHEIIGIN